MNDFYARLYKSGDEEGIINLLKIVFNGWPPFDLTGSELEHWEWKYKNVPSGIHQVGLVLHNHDIIGCNHGIYFQIKIGNNLYLGFEAVDFGVHPDFRRMGVSKLIETVMQKRKAEFDPAVTYVNTGSEIIKQIYKKKGTPKFPYTVRQLLRIDDIDEHLKHSEIKNKKIKSLLFKALKTITNIFRNDDDYSYNIIHINEFKSNANDFFKELKQSYMWIIARTQHYLNWRYCDIRGGNYRVTCIEDSGKLQGYCVSRINRKNPDYPIGILVDILSLPKRNDVSRALIKEAVQYFESNNINCVKAWAIQNNSLETILKDYGFIDIHENVNFYYNLHHSPNSYNDDLENFLNADPNEIHLMYGDTDWI